eukprot:CAMPEP_0179967528 /NCGR_PEP_ID=MMETSP0983-20121128/33252_1 /TAXON_ID=483367 /ORGANISM="non described non described, Strain CCMP 2436" /LENGTH=83 /DNA_ID=CAMNT_0021881011 /DNA_START=39 /DNA_END=290 /DNA_ORIENTATION=+
MPRARAQGAIAAQSCLGAAGCVPAALPRRTEYITPRCCAAGAHSSVQALNPHSPRRVFFRFVSHQTRLEKASAPVTFWHRAAA